jgi:DNA-directed RNA polymerase subunit RPC12/RpoP
MSTADEQLIKQLMTKVQCMFCGRRYRAENVRVLAFQDDVWYLHVVCPRCRSHGLVTAIIQQGTPVVVDVSEEEWTRFREKAPVSADDLLDMHELLRDYGNDFGKLLGPARPPSRHRRRRPGPHVRRA